MWCGMDCGVLVWGVLHIARCGKLRCGVKCGGEECGICNVLCDCCVVRGVGMSDVV